MATNKLTAANGNGNGNGDDEDAAARTTRIARRECQMKTEVSASVSSGRGSACNEMRFLCECEMFPPPLLAFLSHLFSLRRTSAPIVALVVSGSVVALGNRFAEQQLFFPFSAH